MALTKCNQQRCFTGEIQADESVTLFQLKSYKLQALSKWKT